jgi:diguanylate cyclase (GGDEF)-like protein
VKYDTMPEPGRLGRSVTRASVISSAAALLIAAVLLVSFQFLSQRSGLLEDMLIQARVIGDSSEASLLFQDGRAARGMLAVLSTSPNIDVAAVFDRSGSPLAYWKNHDTSLADWAPPLMPYQDFGLQYLEIVQPVHSEGQVIGHVGLRVRLDQFYRRLLIFIGFTVIVVVASFAATYILLACMRRAVNDAEAELNYLAHIDSVTGLPNRHAFNARLTLALNKGNDADGATALLMLDLDNFKRINDTLGHQSGDMLLRSVAHTLTAHLEKSETVCRIGGDEFAVIMEGMNLRERAELAAETIMEELRKPVVLDGHEIFVTTSIGISFYPRDAGDLHTLVRNADTAMYQAKAKGKNVWASFHARMDTATQRRHALESGLRRALERNEMEVYYQPQANLATGEFTGVEALLRWRHPELGMVEPTEFIPVAEDCGMIEALGLWVLRSACEQGVTWSKAGLGSLSVAVNLSARQTRDLNLIHTVSEILEQTGLPPCQLELEITESVLMDNMYANVEVLNQFRQLGIRLAIDDFGTGYSSFAYLKRFTLDHLKIDRTFVKEIRRDGEDGAIIAAIVSMAHALGLSVIAEGVETQEQVAFLRKIGCDIMQGYFFAQPMPANQMTAFLMSARLACES